MSNDEDLIETIKNVIDYDMTGDTEPLGEFFALNYTPIVIENPKLVIRALNKYINQATTSGIVSYQHLPRYVNIMEDFINLHEELSGNKEIQEKLTEAKEKAEIHFKTKFPGFEIPKEGSAVINLRHTLKGLFATLTT